MMRENLQRLIYPGDMRRKEQPLSSGSTHGSHVTPYGDGTHESRLFQLQRHCGNRYVQRALCLARQGEDKADFSPKVEAAIERSRGGGQGLDRSVRRRMEAAFRADFDGVRVHTGADADALNKAVNAVAFTTGRDIFFRDGAYNPGTLSGKELLAHELTHVVQQDGAAPISGTTQRLPIQRLCSDCEEQEKGNIQGKLTVGQPDDEYEKEADRVARSIADGQDLAGKGDVLASVDDTDDYGDMGDNLEPKRRTGAGDEVMQRQDGGAAAACAQPVNFTLGAAHDSGPDAIQIPITWDSSTGDLADLGNCTIREVVNYDPIPNPPFLWNPPNPTILTVPGVDGAAQDTHSYPPGLKNGITDPRQSGTAVAHQVYQCRCTGPGCNGTWQTLPGQNYTITREVFPQYVRINPWRYRITKTGVANGSREVEVPVP